MNEVLFNRDLVKIILTRCNYDDLLSYCLTHKNDILSDKIFWEEKAFYDFRHPIDIFRQTILSPINRYKQLCINYNNVYKGAENIMGRFVPIAIINKRYDLIKYLKNKGYDNYNYYRSEYASIGTIFDITYFNEYFDTLCGALKGKQYDIYDKLKIMPFYKNIKHHHVNKILASIAFSGNINLFDEMLEKYVTEIDENMIKSAVSNNQKLMYDHLLTLLNSPNIYYLESLCAALENNNFDLYEYIFNSLDYILGSRRIASLIISKERINLFDQLVNREKIDDDWNWTQLICDSLETLNPYVYNHVLKHVPEDYVYLYDFDSKVSRHFPEYERKSGFDWEYILHDLIIRSSFKPRILNYAMTYLKPKNFDCKYIITVVKFYHPEYANECKKILNLNKISTIFKD